MRTQTFYNSRNLVIWDRDYSPTRGASLWETCPIHAINQDPLVGHVFFDDFHDFKLSGTDIGWTRTATGAGTSVISDAACGVLLNTNAAADNDMIQIQWNSEIFLPAASKPLWFEARVKVSDATQSDMYVGLAVLDTSIVVSEPSDGIWWRKNDGDALLDFATVGTSTETASTSQGTLVDDTWVRLGFFHNGNGSVYSYINGVLKATHTTNIPATELTPSFAIQNGEGVAKTGSVDYIKVVQIR
jgi:hypothetical protein